MQFPLELNGLWIFIRRSTDRYQQLSMAYIEKGLKTVTGGVPALKHFWLPYQMCSDYKETVLQLHFMQIHLGSKSWTRWHCLF